MISTNDVQSEYPSPDAPEPSGLEWSEIAPVKLAKTRTSKKYCSFDPQILPLFIAEMDFAVAPEIREAIIERVAASDLGYIHDKKPLANAFADFAQKRWQWQVNPEWVHLATDVSAVVVEGLRLLVPLRAARIGTFTPVYNGFYEMFKEFPDLDLVEIDFITANNPAQPAQMTIDFAALERAFAGDEKQNIKPLDALLLANPHNPHGIAWSYSDLDKIAELAAKYNVPVLSDEIHAPLTHRDTEFVPFAKVAHKHDVLAFAGHSAGKAWGITGSKCAWFVAATAKAQQLLEKLPPEVGYRASILGMHASIAALTKAVDWLDRVVERIEANSKLLHKLLAEKLPGINATVPNAGYLSWVDLRDTPIGSDPWQAIFDEGKAAFGDGKMFGNAGRGFIRFNLACAPEIVCEGVTRLQQTLLARGWQPESS